MIKIIIIPAIAPPVTPNTTVIQKLKKTINPKQIPVNGQTKTDKSNKKDETEIDINYILKNFD